ncbi:unnamed protein product [Schistosoma mattheei]|uniref:Uncharacterized protein n=1 Tax=Schistosoma mattheei TaxID=31246 RepID=A0A183NI20_9TREM|nr:unnamed protein product [Schistosoma mattheei]
MLNVDNNHLIMQLHNKQHIVIKQLIDSHLLKLTLIHQNMILIFLVVNVDEFVSLELI